MNPDYINAPTIGEHITALRKALLVPILAFIILLIVSYKAAITTIGYITSLFSVSSILPYDSFSSIIHLDIYIALFITMPFFIYGLMRWFKPVFNNIDILGYVFLSSILFYIGAFFGLIIINYFSLSYFNRLSEQIGLSTNWSITKLIDFIMLNGLISGLIFLLPIILYLLVKNNVVQYKTILKMSAPILITLMVICAFITPPDLVSLIIMFLPILILYSISLLIIKYTMRRNKNGVRND